MIGLFHFAGKQRFFNNEYQLTLLNDFIFGLSD